MFSYISVHTVGDRCDSEIQSGEGGGGWSLFFKMTHSVWYDASVSLGACACVCVCTRVKVWVGLFLYIHTGRFIMSNN